jgi:hypothetical protein
MKKICNFMLLVFVVLSFTGCTDNDKSVINTIQHKAAGVKWEYECLPEGYISFVDTDETLSSKIHSKIYAAYSGTGSSYYYKFKAEKPGAFTLCWVCYNPPIWINMYESYAVDYTINENLEIQQVGEQRPIYEVEKYDKYLFEQFSNQYELHIEQMLDDYPDVTYSATSTYETRMVDITIYGSNPDDESKLRRVIVDHVNNKFQNLNEVMHDTIVNVTFANSVIKNPESD